MNNKTYVGFYIPKDLRKEFKIKCIQRNNQTMTSILIGLIKKWVDNSEIVNE